MKRVMSIAVCSLIFALGFASADAGEFEGFEAFARGAKVQSPPKWSITGSATAIVADDTAAQGSKSLRLTPPGAGNTTIWRTEPYRGDVRASACIKLPAHRGPANPKFYIQQDAKPLVRLEFFYGGDAPDSFHFTAGAREYHASLDGINRFPVNTDWTRYEIFWSESRDQVAMKINGTLIEHYYDKGTKTWIKQAFLPVAELDYLNNLRFDGTVAGDSASPYMADSLGVECVTESVFLADSASALP